MQEKYKQLLEALLESSKEFLNSQELGELAGISQRTVIRYMKELKRTIFKIWIFYSYRKRKRVSVRDY